MKRSPINLLQGQVRQGVSKATISDKIVAGSSELDPRKTVNGRERHVQVETTGSDDCAGRDAGRCDSVAAVLRPRTPTPRPATLEQVGMSAERLGRITTVLKEEIADGKLPGAVVMVARKGKIIYSDAIGFQDKGANTQSPA